MINYLTFFLLIVMVSPLSLAKDKVNPDGSIQIDYQFAKDEKVISFNKGKLKVSANMFNQSTDINIRMYACLDCHGKNAQGGVFYSNKGTFYNPSLVGLSKDYIKSELNEFKSKKRIADEMNIIAPLLTDETINFMAETLSAYKPVPIISNSKISQLMTDDALFKQGQNIAIKGIGNKVIACFACHGINGVGGIGPRLAGQNAGHIRTQLNNYQRGNRQSKSLMNDIANKMQAQEVSAIAHYYESLSDSNPYSYRDKYIYENNE